MQTDHKKAIEQIVFTALILFFITGFRFFALFAAILLFLLLIEWSYLTTVARGFKKVSTFIGRWVSSVILTVFFYVIFTPYARMMRLFSRATTEKFFIQPKGSAFVNDEKIYTPSSFETLW